MIDAEKIITDGHDKRGAYGVITELVKAINAELEKVGVVLDSHEKWFEELHDAFPKKPANEMPELNGDDVVYIDGHYGPSDRAFRDILVSQHKNDILEIHRRINGALTKIWSRKP